MSVWLWALVCHERKGAMTGAGMLFGSCASRSVYLRVRSAGWHPGAH
jgi:hypothetical protein